MTGWGRQTRRLWSLVLIQTSLRAVAPETTQSSNLATSAVFSSYNNSTITADAGISSPVQNATAQNSAKRAADPEADAFLIPNQSQLVYTKINLPLTDNFWIGTCLYREVLEQQLLNFGSSPSRGRGQDDPDPDHERITNVYRSLYKSFLAKNSADEDDQFCANLTLALDNSFKEIDPRLTATIYAASRDTANNNYDSINLKFFVTFDSQQGQNATETGEADADPELVKISELLAKFPYLQTNPSNPTLLTLTGGTAGALLTANLSIFNRNLAVVFQTPNTFVETDPISNLVYLDFYQLGSDSNLDIDDYKLSINVDLDPVFEPWLFDRGNHTLSSQIRIILGLQVLASEALAASSGATVPSSPVAIAEPYTIEQVVVVDGETQEVSLSINFISYLESQTVGTDTAQSLQDFFDLRFLQSNPQNLNSKVLPIEIYENLPPISVNGDSQQSIITSFAPVANSQILSGLETLGLQKVAILLGRVVNSLTPEMTDIIIPSNNLNVVGLVFGILFALVAMAGIIAGCYFFGKYRDDNATFYSGGGSSAAKGGQGMFLGGNTGMVNYGYGAGAGTTHGSSYPPSYNNTTSMNTNQQQNNPWNHQVRLNPSQAMSTSTSVPPPSQSGNFSHAGLTHRNSQLNNSMSLRSSADGNAYEKWMDWSRRMANGGQ